MRFTLKLLSKLANLRVRLLPSEATRPAVRRGGLAPSPDPGSGRAGDGERANFANEIAGENLIFFSIFISVSLFLYTFNHPYFFRYLVPLIPLFIYIAAWIITNAKPVWSLIPLISLILMTAKTFPNYLFEITHPYQNANAEIIGFLSSLDPEKYQKLAVNYDDFTFRFHTSFTVYGAQHLTHPCPDVIIIFPDWGNETLLREIATQCQLTPSPLPLHYAKLADDPDPTNHRFTQPPLRTLEVFLAPPSPS